MHNNPFVLALSKRFLLIT